MKKLLLPLIFLMLNMPAMTQGWIVITGNVTDSTSGYPVQNYPVTVMSDSLNGFLYYNVVYTDSVGHYYDDVPILLDSTGVIYVVIFDCNDNRIEAIININPGSNTYTQDFQICSYSDPCQADFFYIPEPQGANDSFRFWDNSTGNIIEWYWSFGDSTSSIEQNPFHAFPGPGSYEICLTVTSSYCTDTYCETISISDTLYQQVYGQVIAGNFPLQTGIVTLFAMNPNGSYTPFGEEFTVDSNGVYYFTLVPEGIYLIQATPYGSNSYLPTYYGDVINWQQATQVVIGVPENPFNINLIMAGPMTPGPGSITGQINGILEERSSIDLISMMLMNESAVTIGFSEVDGSGQFKFPSVDYGIYYLRAELSGVASDNMKIEITPENPHMDVVLNYTGNSILDLEDIETAENILSVYPNPVSEYLQILLNLPVPDMIEIEIFTVTGQSVYHTLKSAGKGQNNFMVPVYNFPGGIYTLRIYSEDGINVVRRIIKS